MARKLHGPPLWLVEVVDNKALALALGCGDVGMAEGMDKGGGRSDEGVARADGVCGDGNGGGGG